MQNREECAWEPWMCLFIFLVVVALDDKGLLFGIT